MRIVVGLGNPGEQYRATRHNIGYLILSEVARRVACESPKSKFRADALNIQVRDEKVLLICPTTFMNRSGSSVLEASRFYKVPPENVFVVCDDLNLPFAKIRIRSEGSSGGQKGLQDVIRVLGTEKIPRLRFGIGQPPAHWDAADYVLANFCDAEKKLLPEALKNAADAVLCYLNEGLNEAMNRYNGRIEN